MPADGPEREGVVWRLNPATSERQEVAILRHPNGPAQYVSRGAVDHHGNLFFGSVGVKPVGIFKVRVPAHRRKENAHLPIRCGGEDQP